MFHAAWFTRFTVWWVSPVLPKRMFSPETREVNSTVVFPPVCFYYHLAFMFRKVHGKFVKLLFVSFPSISHSKSYILLFVCFLSGTFRDIWADSWDPWTFFFIPVISRWEIYAVAFSGDYEKCFFPRQARAFCLKRYVLILIPYWTIVWNFQLKAKL